MAAYTVVLPPTTMTTPDHELKKQLRIVEIVNGRAAMLGIIAALGAYICTGQIVPGLF